MYGSTDRLSIWMTGGRTRPLPVGVLASLVGGVAVPLGGVAVPVGGATVTVGGDTFTVGGGGGGPMAIGLEPRGPK